MSNNEQIPIGNNKTEDIKTEGALTEGQANSIMDIMNKPKVAEGTKVEGQTVVKTEVQTEGQTAEGTEGEMKTETVPVNEQLLSLGEQRYDKTAKFINGAGEKLKGWITKGTSKFGGFMKGAVVRAFAAPEAIAHGVKVTGEKIGEEVKYVKEGVIDPVKETVVEGFKSVGEDIKNADKYIGQKAMETGKWIGHNATSAYEYTSEKLDKAEKWMDEKDKQLSDWMDDKALTAEAYLSLKKEKTAEKLNEVKGNIVKNYEKLMKFGEGAMDTARLKIMYARDGYNARKNARREARIKERAELDQRKSEILEKRSQATLKKLEDLKEFNNQNKAGKGVERNFVNNEALAA